MKKYETQAVILFSRLIRILESDENGNCTCFITGEKRFWKEMVAGHFLKSRYEKYRFSKINVHSITPESNMIDELNHQLYIDKMIENYGKDNVENMYVEKNKYMHRSENDYKEMCSEFKKEIDELLMYKLW